MSDTEHAPLVDESEPGVVAVPRARAGVHVPVVVALVGSVVLVVLGVAFLVWYTWSAAPIPAPQALLFAAVRPDALRELMRNFSALAHIAGSAQDERTWTAERLRTYGLSVTTERIPVMLSYPTRRLVELTQPSYYNCSLKEAVLPDGTSGDPSAVPTWNGYSAPGDTTAPLVYANYGRAEDFAALDALGVNITGCIVIVRYGQIFRGNKAKFAAERGAVGVLIYVDPSDTGFDRGPVYMDGPWSSNTTVQRGSVWVGEGDPSTPGWPSFENGPRLTHDEASHYEPDLPFASLPRIPIQPLGYGDAQPLLAAIGGARVPSPSWGGGFDTRFVGPGPAMVHIVIETVFNVTPIWNVHATVRGSEEPDKHVHIGCHRDAWTMGAGDPISGHSVLLETARAMGELLKTGWRPKRSIVFHSWDAEEYALVGSVEHVERYLVALKERAVAYLNLDVGVSGMDVLTVTATPSLSRLVRTLARQVPVPPANGTRRALWDLWSGTFSVPGTGSDHTAFAHHAGIPITYAGISGRGNAYDAVYHSNYDSFYWFTHWGDPTFAYHAALAKLHAALLLRLSTDAVLPLSFVDYAAALRPHVADLANTTRLDVTRLSAAVDDLERAANATATEAASASGAALRALNGRIQFTERSFLVPSLSPVRWFDHVLWTPSPSDSYAGLAFLCVYDAVARNGTGTHDAQFVLERLALVVRGAADFLAPDALYGLQG